LLICTISLLISDFFKFFLNIFLHLKTRLTILVLFICTFSCVFSKEISFVFFGAHWIQSFKVSIFYRFALSRRSSYRFSTNFTFLFGNGLIYFRDVNGVIGEYSACLKWSTRVFFKLYDILCFSLNDRLFLLNRFIDKNAVLFWADIHLTRFIPLGRLFCRRLWWAFASFDVYLRRLNLLNIYLLRKTLWIFYALFLLAISERIFCLNRLPVHDL